MSIQHFFYSPAEAAWEYKNRPRRPRRFCQLADGSVMEYTSSRTEKEKGVIPVHNWDDAIYLGSGCCYYGEGQQTQQTVRMGASA